MHQMEESQELEEKGVSAATHPLLAVKPGNSWGIHADEVA